MTDHFDMLLVQLESSDIQQRSQAIFELQPDKISDERVIPYLVNILCTEPDLNIVEDATWVLVRYGTDATPALLKTITHDNALARHNIVHALGKIADRQAVPALKVATQDTDSTVRQKAVYALGQIGDADAIDTLILKLDDPVQDIRWTAREALETFGKIALPQLIQAFTMESPQVRELSASLLGDIADSSSVDALIKALDTDDWQVRFAIVEALGQIGDRQAKSAIERMMTDSDVRVRAIAKEILKIQ